MTCQMHSNQCTEAVIYLGLQSTFEFRSTLAKILQLGTDALAEVRSSAHKRHVTRHTPHVERHVTATCLHRRSRSPACSSHPQRLPLPETAAALSRGSAALTQEPAPYRFYARKRKTGTILGHAPDWRERTSLQPRAAVAAVRGFAVVLRGAVWVTCRRATEASSCCACCSISLGVWALLRGLQKGPV